MRPATYTPDQIIEAGRVLVARGQAVNGFSLRKHLGGGNPARLISIWQSSRDTECLEADQVLPDEVSEVVDSLRLKLEPIFVAAAVEVFGKLSTLARADALDIQMELDDATTDAANAAERFGEIIEELESKCQVESDRLQDELRNSASLKVIVDELRYQLASSAARVEMFEARALAAESLSASLVSKLGQVEPKPARKTVSKLKA